MSTSFSENALTLLGQIECMIVNITSKSIVRTLLELWGVFKSNDLVCCMDEWQSKMTPSEIRVLQIWSRCLFRSHKIVSVSDSNCGIEMGHQLWTSFHQVHTARFATRTRFPIPVRSTSFLTVFQCLFSKESQTANQRTILSAGVWVCVRSK